MKFTFFYTVKSFYDLDLFIFPDLSPHLAFALYFPACTKFSGSEGCVLSDPLLLPFHQLAECFWPARPQLLCHSGDPLSRGSKSPPSHPNPRSPDRPVPEVQS